MDLACRERDRLPWTSEPFRLPETLIADLPVDDGQRLLLLMVDVQRRTGTGLDDVLDFEAITVSTGHSPDEREALSMAVVYRVWIGAESHTAVILMIFCAGP